MSALVLSHAMALQAPLAKRASMAFKTRVSVALIAKALAEQFAQHALTRLKMATKKVLIAAVQIARRAKLALMGF